MSPGAAPSSFEHVAADMTVNNIDHLMMYDAYDHLTAYGLEDLGCVGMCKAATSVKRAPRVQVDLCR